MTFKLKDESVKVAGVKPEITIAIQLCHSVFQEFNEIMVVTSLTDGKEWRSESSLHPKGHAFDLRTWNFTDPEKLGRLLFKLRTALGDEFDVVLEKDHIHIEFDPK